ncbi:transcriptional repressor LexA [Pseudomonadales bacterium]|nr:transcriptional repressor LexA [Pseudomonadales bacterium]MDB9942356.1 transcriptional repressor LexA [Pseudomonadales bacterium]MDC0174417.1 transcriptional repressor LexA [Pseudomonadales bacterium]MDC1306790.1 transcriptional repressor LexA [Pseudomonadales bacterium]
MKAELKSPTKLTPRQAEVLAFIKSYLDETGYPPTRADIARQLGFKSANASEEHLKALARKGAIEMIPGTSRGIKLPESNGIPIVGRVAAGSPILAQEHIEDYCELSPNFFKPAADYLLTVHGDSMIECGILDGDLLAVHRTQSVNNGDIIVARVEDEVTVKRLQTNRSKHLITLLPENADFKPIEVDLRHQSFSIEGLMVGILRH